MSNLQTEESTVFAPGPFPMPAQPFSSGVVCLPFVHLINANFRIASIVHALKHTYIPLEASWEAGNTRLPATFDHRFYC